MEDDSTHHLDVEGPLAEGALRSLADSGKGLEEELLERLAVLEPLLELDGLRCELGVGQLLEVGLERGDVGRLVGEPLDAPAFADPQYLLESTEILTGHAGTG